MKRQYSEVSRLGAEAQHDAHRKIAERLTEQEASFTDIHDSDVVFFCASIRSNSVLRVLDLRGSTICQESANLIAAAVLESQTIESFGGVPFKKLLAADANVPKLDLEGAACGYAGALVLAEVLKVNKTLTSLNLAKSGLGSEGVAVIAASIKENSALTELNLSCNHIGEVEVGKDRYGLPRYSADSTAITALSGALQRATALSVLNLAWNALGKGPAAGVTMLVDAIKASRSLTSLDLCGNDLDSNAACSVVRATQDCNKLSFLNLRCNAIDTCEELATALAESACLEGVYLSGNKIGAGGIAKILQAKQTNQVLTFIDLQTAVGGIKEQHLFKDASWVMAKQQRARNQGGRQWKSAKQVVGAEHYELLPASTPTYPSISSGTSLLPPKKYCDITGFEAKYTDPRTKLRYSRAELYSTLKVLPNDTVSGYLALRNAEYHLR